MREESDDGKGGEGFQMGRGRMAGEERERE